MKLKKACDRCHRLKQTCTGEPVCYSCEKAKVECTHLRPPLKMGRPRTRKEARRPKVKYSHNGCLNCKKKKQKCDENWPTCLSCSRLQITCTRPSSIVDMTDDISKIPAEPDNSPLEKIRNDLFSLADLDNTNIDIMGLAGDLFDDSSTLNNKERFFLNCLIKSPSFLEGLLEPTINEDILSTNALVLPVNLMESPPTDSNEFSESFEEQKRSLVATCVSQSYKIPDKELELLKYFITDVSSLLFVDKTSTTFLRTVVPICMENENVRYPIIGIAAAHRANSLPGVNIDYKRDAIIYRAKAQSLFIANPIDYFTDSEDPLLSILLLAIQEILEGTSLYWLFALEKAAKIINKRGGLKVVSKFAPLSVQLFCYLDLISSLSTCATPFVDNNQGNYDDVYVKKILNSKFGFKFGIAGELFNIVGNISTLASLRPLRHDSAENEKAFSSLAILIEMKLQKWSPSLDGSKYQIDSSIQDERKMLSSYAIALQWASFLRLHQIMYGYNREDQRIKACLDLILSSTKEIRPDSGLETGLMFPLIMAGSVAYQQKDREYILSRIRGIKERLKFNYLGEFENLLLLVWNRDSEENHSVNWAKIRFFHYSGLVMF